MALTTSKRLHLSAAVILTYAVCVLSLKGCPSCGSTPVPYPLSTAPDCGDQSYKIRCNATSLFFDSLNNTYPITSISPSNQRLTIEPSPFLANTCITTSHGFQLNSSAPFNITSSNTVFYLNCSTQVLMFPLNCTSNSLCHVYINGTAGSGCVDTQACCALQTGDSVTKYKLGFNGDVCSAYRSFVNLDYSLPVSRWPAPGVELEWLLPREPTCEELGDCDSGSTCSPDPNSNGLIKRCFCNSGLQWDSVVGQCIEVPDGRDKVRIALITGLTTGLGVALLAALIGFLFYMRHQRINKEQERLTREREEILNAGEKQGFLSWLRRLSIAHETAEGLSYLHFDAVPRIYHLDVKSSNILLDSNLNAKVSDFGLSRLVHTDLSHISTCAQGTIGYLDPEYFRNFQLTNKSDVYSFGVVLLELLTSQKVVDVNREEDDVSLVAYVQRLVKEERIMDVVDPMLTREGVSNMGFQSMKALGFLAIRCLNEHRQNRPSMKEVAEEIEYIISIATADVAE
ncbi:unnamed protein product [Fraxinus pennsylvanica]|uniref:Protein kinase domain-containing protein n=1 Tax=Fraxinus pennsylvanica TaxID=56036 RepID=A0AAD2E319_9LAMI|nr:unnamed protein product [Fraxinus pennsylvanica]